jgi:hypothetical protein
VARSGHVRRQSVPLREASIIRMAAAISPRPPNAASPGA